MAVDFYEDFFRRIQFMALVIKKIQIPRIGQTVYFYGMDITGLDRFLHLQQGLHGKP